MAKEIAGKKNKTRRAILNFIARIIPNIRRNKKISPLRRDFFISLLLSFSSLLPSWSLEAERPVAEALALH